MSKYAHLSDEEIFAQYKQRLPSMRAALAKLTSLLKNFFGKTFSAFATDVLVQDMSGRDEADDKGGSGSDSLTVSGFKAPSAAKLRGYIDAQTYADTLDFLKETVSRMEKKDSSMHALHAEAKRMRDAMAVTYNNALDMMTELANKTLPDNIGNLFKIAEKTVASIVGIPPQDVFILIDVRKDEGVHFVLTLDISSSERESKTDILAVVITAAMSEKGKNEYDTKFFLSVHEKSVLPFRYNMGVEVPGNSIKNVGSKLKNIMERELAAHHVVAVIAPVNLPVDDVTISTMLKDIKGVAGVNVFEDSIEVEIPADNKDVIGDVVRALNNYPELRKMLSGKYNPRFAQIEPGLWKYTISLKV